MAYAGLQYIKTDDKGNIIKISNKPVYEDTNSFKEMVPKQTDRDKIKKIIQDEAAGSNNPKGNSSCD